MEITIPDDAYCTLSDVQGALPSRTYNAVSRPSLDQAEQIIKDIASEIDCELRQVGYKTLPLTDADDVDVLRVINKLGAAWRIESSTLMGTNGYSQIANDYRLQYEKKMESIKKGYYKFAGAGQTESAQPDANTFSEPTEPIFRIDDTERNRF